ncbi:Putative SOS response-associated peptidase YedK [Defluviimonas aquaemixtae]|uniref:Abasic site processing protein n=1 Tax=Albidovulum aquaemixtae TaxID=1542388 RepID=A0A2R8BLX6_9RHOB|nr:SOS response-associated peptidase [Defluviimonas aquaemixtae]SPH24444.1 Putative SOS response-associated peptidase YedK [Defluviimonas aquaemixtae]
MCGRMSHAGLTSQQLFDWLEHGIKPEGYEPDIPQSWNVPPTSMIPIVRRIDGELRMDMARWWLVPHWHRGGLKELKAATFNARSETVAKVPAFRDAYRRNRCVVPAAGYYEWQVGDHGKRPHFIHAGGNAPALVFAGLWTSVKLPDYEGLTCTILTEESAGKLRDIHSRAPVMLDPDAIADWLDGADIAQVVRLPETRLAWHEVGPDVGAVRNDGPQLIEPVG